MKEKGRKVDHERVLSLRNRTPRLCMVLVDCRRHQPTCRRSAACALSASSIALPTNSSQSQDPKASRLLPYNVYRFCSFYFLFYHLRWPCDACIDRSKIGECRTSTDTDGGKHPSWENKSRSVFTFYVPATVTLDSLSLVLDVINDNIVSDAFIGTTGSIGLDRVRFWGLSSVVVWWLLLTVPLCCILAILTTILSTIPTTIRCSTRLRNNNATAVFRRETS